MKILVTGATGFLGGHLARHLVSTGHQVTGVGRNAEAGAALTSDGVSFLRADLRDPRQWRDAVEGHDAVVHCAARSTLWGRWADFRADNVDASAAVARAAVDARARLVAISSPSVYNATGVTTRVREDQPVGPRFDSMYARSKWLGEQAVARVDPSALILRPRGIHGDGDVAIVPRIAGALKAGRLPRLVSGEVWTHLSHVDNVVAAIDAGLASDVAGPVNITDLEPVGIWAAIDAVADAIGAPRPTKRVPARLVETVAAAMELAARCHPARPEPPLTASGVRLLTSPMSLDLTRAVDEMGYRPVHTAAEGLDLTIGGLRA